MRIKFIHSILLLFVFISVGCSEIEVGVPSFSSLASDAFDDAETDEPRSVIEGVDFQFEEADLTHSYEEELNNS